MLVLLAEDVATVPEDLLQKAIDKHVTSVPFMPKAADLIRLASEVEASRPARLVRTGNSYADDLAADYNSRRTRFDHEWAAGSDGSVYLRDLSA